MTNNMNKRNIYSECTLKNYKICSASIHKYSSRAVQLNNTK